MIYTMAGSLGLLLAIQMIGVVSGTFDLPDLFKRWHLQIRAGVSLLGLPVETVKAIAFWAFVIAFAIKVPVWPFHTWLPDAHTEAPTAGSMILAGVLLKLGAYGFLRLVLPLYPVEANILCRCAGISWRSWRSSLGPSQPIGPKRFQTSGGLFIRQPYGFCGCWELRLPLLRWERRMRRSLLNGAVLQMFNHGLSAAGMFFLVGVIYERTHTRDLNEIWRLIPAWFRCMAVS